MVAVPSGTDLAAEKPPYPKSRPSLSSPSTDWLMKVGWMSWPYQPMSAVRPCQLQSFLWRSAESVVGPSSVPILLSSLPFHRCWGQGHSRINTLSTKLRICFQEDPISNTLCWAFYTEFFYGPYEIAIIFPIVTDEGIKAKWSKQLL